MSRPSFRIRSITFERILPIWRDSLWPARASAIEPASAVLISGEIGMEAMAFTPRFFGAFSSDGELMGVVGGQLTSPTDYRVRGVFVFPEHRGKGVATELIEAAILQGRKEGATRAWMMSREATSALPISAGFRVIGKTDRYEYGPHYLLEREIRQLSSSSGFRNFLDRSWRALLSRG